MRVGWGGLRWGGVGVAELVHDIISACMHDIIST